jgi:hypothetical protein
MPLKVIGAGFGRTGTMSLKLALEQLGFGPCHHMAEVMADPPSARLWVEAAEGRPDWEKVFQGYRSAVDFPTCMFYRELAEHYPDAKLILTLRDPESWFASTQATIFNPATTERIRAFPDVGALIQKLLIEGPLQGRLTDREHALAFFRAHNEEVQRTIPPERLLVYNVAEGWGRLCAFLGVTAPATAFPNANTREEFGQMTAARLKAGAPAAH